MTLNPLTSGSTVNMGPAATPSSAMPRFTPLDPIRILRQYAWLLVISAIIGAGVGTGLYFYLQEYRPEYTTEAQLLILSPVTQAGDTARALREDSGSLRGMATFIRNQQINLKSRDVLNDTLKRTRVQATDWYKSFPSIEEALENLEETVNADPIRGSTVIRVTMNGQHELNTVLDELIESYLRIYELDTQIQTNKIQVMFQRQRDATEQELIEVQEDQDRFNRENNILRIENRETREDYEYRRLTALAFEMQQRVVVAENQYKATLRSLQESAITADAGDMTAIDNHPDIVRMRGTIDALRQSIAMLVDKFGPNHGEIERRERRIRVIENDIKKKTEELLRIQRENAVETARETYERTVSNYAQIQRQTEEARQKVRDVDRKLTEYNQMKERANDIIRRRDRLEAKLKNIAELKARPDFNRIQKKQDATRPKLTFPDMTSTIAGMTMAFVVFCAGLVFLKELLDQRIKSPTDVRLLPQVDLLGTIPATSEDPSGPAVVEGIVEADPGGLMAEAFRQVRTAVMDRMDRRGYRTLMLVSAQARCGTSAMANNLAMSLVHNGRRVALIDGNLRRPAQHRLFKIDAQPGLAEVLQGTTSLDAALVSHHDGRLGILPAGDAHDLQPELVESAKFREMISKLEADFDLVLIDAPPALVTSEAKLLSKQVDAVVAVVRAMSDKRGMIGRMIRELGIGRADLLGLVLNDVRSSAGGYFRKNYEDFYRYRNGGKTGKQRGKAKAQAEA